MKEKLVLSSKNYPHEPGTPGEMLGVAAAARLSERCRTWYSGAGAGADGNGWDGGEGKRGGKRLLLMMMMMIYDVDDR